jgi:predicted dienelactone hydrolase
VFSQGFDVLAESYAALLRAWASAGYVVAAPTYPDTSPNGPGPVNENDIVNHPADLRFVISALLAASRDRTGPLYGLIDRRQIALIGHSDGGDVSLAVAAGRCCRDPRITAAIILSGAERSAFGGTYYTAGSPPLLVVQGGADTVNLPACSVMLYNAAPAPKYYLDIPGAEHQPPYKDPGPARHGVQLTTTAFLDSYLKREPARLKALERTGALPAGEALSSAPAAPFPAGSYCPGA